MARDGAGRIGRRALGVLRVLGLTLVMACVFLLGVSLGSIVDLSCLGLESSPPAGAGGRALKAEWRPMSFFEQVKTLQTPRVGFETHASFVKKKAFKDGVRFLFIAGLEGTGHHAWETIFRACMTENFCHTPQVLQKLLYKNSSWGLFNPIMKGRTVQKDEWMARRNQVKKEMERELARVGKEKVVVLNVAEYTREVGEMSYPNFAHGPERSLRKPDLTLLARMAEEVGIDFRILVLQRDARGIYHSTVTHRHFMAGLPQSMVLIDNAHSLFGQLMSIDPAFVRCISNYGTNPDVSTRGREIASFVHPAFAGEKATLWNRLLRKVHAVETEEEDNRIDKLLMGRLEAATDLIDNYCGMLP